MSNHIIIRLTRYLIERFSLFAIVPATIIHYLFIARYAGFTMGLDNWLTWLTGYLTFIGFYLCLRLSDELKDVEHDNIHYKNRPIQRGLISISEVRYLLYGVIAALTVLNIVFSNSLGLLFYGLTLGYLGLMRAEFFVSEYLRPRLMLYLGLHQLFTPLLVAYLLYHLGAGVSTARDGLFLLLNLLIVISIEIARKIRPTSHDNTGGDTYSAHLGKKPAVALLLVNLVAIVWLLYSIFHFSIWPVITLALPAASLIYYLKTDSQKGSQAILSTTTLYTIICMVVYL